MTISIQETHAELSKKTINTAIFFIVIIFKNTSRKFALNGFTGTVESFMMVSNG